MRERKSSLGAHLRSRIDPLASALLVFPLFVVYQVGILFGVRGANGVDFTTRLLMDLCQRDPGLYLALLAAMVTAYAVTVAILRRSRRFRPPPFAAVLAESTVYAVSMGVLILFAIDRFLDLVPELSLLSAETWVISAGAGFHEELLFRVILMGGAARLLAPVLGRRRAWLLALLVSSLFFSLAHHVGPTGEPMTAMVFSYRALAGAYFAVLYWYRGFGVAAWTHTLYDLCVLSFG